LKMTETAQEGKEKRYARDRTYSEEKKGKLTPSTTGQTVIAQSQGSAPPPKQQTRLFVHGQTQSEPVPDSRRNQAQRTSPTTDREEPTCLPNETTPPLDVSQVLEATPVNNVIYASVQVEQTTDGQSSSLSVKHFWRYLLVAVIAGLVAAATSVLLVRAAQSSSSIPPKATPVSAPTQYPFISKGTFPPTLLKGTVDVASLAPTTICPTMRCVTVRFSGLIL
jgi:hypothetical protein